MRSIIIVSIFVLFQILGSLASNPSHRLNFFDINLLQYAATQKGNVMVSPASIKSTLAMLLEGADGTTASEIKSALRVSPVKDDFRNELRTYLKALQSNTTSVVLQNANAVFVAKQLPLKRQYDAEVRRIYFSEVNKLDFSNPKFAANRINDWVRDKTRGLIPDVLDEDVITPHTEMVVANALYFKAPWKYGFKPKATYSDCFYNNGVCKQVAMMSLHSDLKYAFVDDLRAHALELPYLGDRYSMLLIVPQDRDAITTLIRDLPFVGLPQVIDLMESNDVYVSLPKFDVKYNENMAEALKNMHINALFTQSANLSGIFESGVNPHVSGIYHSVHMKVDEEGTVAAAASMGILVPLINDIVQLRVDRPFLFFIRDNELGLNLFEGKIEEPTEFVESNKGPSQVSQPSIQAAINQATTKQPTQNQGFPSQTAFNQAFPPQTSFNQASSSQTTFNPAVPSQTAFNQAVDDRITFNNNQDTQDRIIFNQAVPNRANFGQANPSEAGSSQGNPGYAADQSNKEVSSHVAGQEHSLSLPVSSSTSSDSSLAATSSSSTTTTTTEAPKSKGVLGWFKRNFSLY